MLHEPDAMKQVEETAASTLRALEAAKRTARPSLGDGAHPRWAMTAILTGAGIVVLIYVVSRRRSRGRAHEKLRDSIG
jgi:hypothetical protein